MNKKNRLGEENINYQNQKMKIIKYNWNKDIDIEFENGWIARNKQYISFKNGTIKNPYVPEIYGIGFLGDGKHKTGIYDKHNKKYLTWQGMLKRCYDKDNLLKRPTYENCSVCSEWHNFQNFGDWFNENYYEVGNEKMCLDKDILYKGNKIYSPDTCVFVPNRINILFVKSDRSRGNYLIGVSKVSNSNNPKRYQASLTASNKTKCFETEIEAFNWYKEEKEKLIKQVAEEYKDKIPKILYDAMYNWKVEIDD